MSDFDDGGFSDVFGEEKTGELNVSSLKKFKVVSSPLYSISPDVDFYYDNLGERKECLCPRFKQLGNPVLPKGELTSKYLFIAPQPDSEDEEYGEMFSNKTQMGQFFESWLSMMGLSRNEVYITSLAICRGIEQELSPKTISCCASLHKAEFMFMENVKFIFTMGNLAFTFMTGNFGSSGSYVGGYVPTIFNGKEANIIPLYNTNYAIGSEFAMSKLTDLFKKIKK